MDITSAEIIKYSSLVGSVVVVIYSIMIYNRLVMLKYNAYQAFSNIDILLKQRHEELPKLVATCREYMKFEQATLEKIAIARSRVSRARSGGDVKGLGNAEAMLRSGLSQLFALVENYPELKANETFQHLQSRISSLEEAIADRREYYNDAVNNSNIQINVVPDNMLASLFNFQVLPLLQFAEEEKRDVNVHELFQAEYIAANRKQA